LFGFVIVTGIDCHAPGKSPLTLPAIVKLFPESVATFHVYDAAGDTFPARSTATTANWCWPLFVESTVYVRGDEHGA
jgi:hypothetical protein